MFALLHIDPTLLLVKRTPEIDTWHSLGHFKKLNSSIRVSSDSRQNIDQLRNPNLGQSRRRDFIRKKLVNLHVMKPLAPLNMHLPKIILERIPLLVPKVPDMNMAEILGELQKILLEFVLHPDCRLAEFGTSRNVFDFFNHGRSFARPSCRVPEASDNSSTQCPVRSSSCSSATDRECSRTRDT